MQDTALFELAQRHSHDDLHLCKKDIVYMLANLVINDSLLYIFLAKKATENQHSSRP